MSAPELAKTVTAPFKIGAGTILNPQDLHWYYVRKFANKAVENGLTPVDVTDERHYDVPVNEISFEAFEWISKNIINMYVDDVGHSTDREGSTVAPTLHELISMGEEKEDFIGKEAVIKKDNKIKNDLDLFISQSNRCSEIIKKLYNTNFFSDIKISNLGKNSKLNYGL